MVPLQIAEVIAGGNAIADFPYVYGGGHALVRRPRLRLLGLGQLRARRGRADRRARDLGPARALGRARARAADLTVFANAGHTFMNVDGVWFDTAGRAGPYSTRWLTQTPSLRGYAVRHYPGL